MSTLAVSKEVAPKADRESNEIRYRKKLSAGHTFRVVLRNSIYAALGRVLVGIVKLLVKKGFSKAFLRRLPGEVFSLNPLKWAAVFGGFSSFRFVMQTVTRVGQLVHLPEKAAALISGCLCSAPVLVMNNETRTELCLYALVRALHTFALRFVLPLLPTWAQKFEHYDVALMCLSSVQISYGCLFFPSTLPASYQAFLVKAAMYDERCIRSNCSYMQGNGLIPDVVSICWERNLPLPTGSDSDVEKLLCFFAHKHYSCNGWAWRFILQNMLSMGLPLYGPLKVVATVAMHRKRLLANPKRVIVRGLRSVFLSSLFLALYTATIIRSCCFCVHHGIKGAAKVSAVCSLAGLATLLEPKGRRMDLALYCGMYALRSFVLTQNRLGRLPYPRNSLIVSVYLLSMSFLFYEYEEEPRLLNGRVRSAFRMLLGEKPASKHQEDRHEGHAHGAAHPDKTPEPTKEVTKTVD